MSIYIPAEREQIYIDFGLEDALEDSVIAPGQMVDLKERRDGFGHNVLMLWIKGEEGIHINIDGVDLPVASERAGDAFEHHYPLISLKLGEGALRYLTQPAEPAAEVA
jgi:hypothetical protein